MAKKALVIDYEPRGIEQLGAPLRQAGYLVTVAKDGIQGLEAFERLQPDITLIEAMLPKKHGFEVCREIKATPHGMKTPVIIVTSVYKGRKYRTQAVHHYGCDAYLEKPVDGDSLLGTVERLMVDYAPSVAADGVPAPMADAPGGPSESDDAVSSGPEVEIADELDRLFPESGPESGNDPEPSASVQLTPVARATSSLAVAPRFEPNHVTRVEPSKRPRARTPLGEAPPRRRSPWVWVGLMLVPIATVLILLAMGVITL